MVAVKEQVLRDVLDQADPGAADSQVVMMAGEEIKVEMLDDPTDESCHEDNTAEVAVGDEDEDPVLVSVLFVVMLLYKPATSQDAASYYSPGGEGFNASLLKIAADKVGEVSPVAMLPGGELPPRFPDSSEEEWEEESVVGDEGIVGEEIAGEGFDVGVTPVCVKEEVSDEPFVCGIKVCSSAL